LRTAVDANNAANSMTAYRALGSADKAQLKADPLLKDLVRVVGNADGRTVLNAIKPNLPAWFDILDAHFGGNNAGMTGSLQDAGLTTASGVASNAAALARFATLSAWAVLQPIVAANANAARHGAILAEPLAIPLCTPGGAVFTVLGSLDSAGTRTAFERVDAARTWIDGDLVTLGTKIPTWRNAGADWVDTMVRLGRVAQIETWYDAGTVAWLPLMRAAFESRSASLRGTFVPGNTLVRKVINATAATNADDAARTLSRMGWQATQTYDEAIAGGWLTATSAAILAGTDAGVQSMLATSATVQAGLAAKTIYILDAFPQIARSTDTIVRLYQTNAGFKTAIESDAARYAALHARIPAIAPVAAPAAPVPAGPTAVPGLQALQTAVTAANRADALTAYGALARGDRRALAGDPLLKAFVGLVGGEEGLGILRTVRPAVGVWLDVGAAHYAATDASLTTILRDAGITSSRTLAANATEVARFPAYHKETVLTTLVQDGSATGQAALLTSLPAVTFVRAAFTGKTTFQAMPSLVSAGTATGYSSNAVAQAWLEADAASFNQKILTDWNTPAAWMTAFLRAGKAAALQALYTANSAGWLPAFQAALARPTAELRAAFVPGNAFGETIIDAVGAANNDAAANGCKNLGWQPVQSIPRANTGNWLTLATVRILVPHDAATQESLVQNAAVLTALTGKAIYPTEAFPELAANSAFVTQAFRTNVPFRTALLADAAKFAALVAAARDKGPWVDAFLGIPDVDRLLTLAAADAATWKRAVDASAGGIDAVINAVPAGGVTAGAPYTGLWAVYGAPSSRSLDQGLRLYGRLAGGRITPPGDRTISDPHPGSVNDGTGNVWNLQKIYLSSQPSAAAMASLLTDLSAMPQAALSVNAVLIFCAQIEWLWWQTAPAGAVSTTWHQFAAPQLRDVGTSYAGGGVTILRVDGRGGPINQRIGTSRDGAADSTGGGSGANKTTPSNLTYFQNHSRHEFGHNVGQSTFNRAAADGGGVLPQGNATVTTWANWQPSSPALMQAAYWNPTAASVNWRVPNPAGPGTINVAISAADAYTYLITALNTLSLPGAGNNVWDNTASWHDGFTRINNTPQFRNTDMMKYLRAIGGENLSRSNAYEFPNFTPPGPTVHFYSTRWNGLASYNKTQFDLIRRPVGWYALSSPNEMFAEIYTKHYSGGITPDASWETFFGQLDRSTSPAVPTPVVGVGATPTGPAAAGETEPPAAVMNTVGS
jgi:hypothetical protein